MEPTSEQPSRETNVSWPFVGVLALLVFAAGFATVHAWTVSYICGDPDSVCGHPTWMKATQLALANIGFVVAVLTLIWSAIGANRKSLGALTVAVVLYAAWLPMVTHVASTY